MLHDLDRVHRCRGHVVVVLSETRGGAVVEHEAILAQHQAITGLAYRESRKGIAIDAVKEDAGVAPLDVDLTERRDIAHADVIAYIRHLAVHSVLRLLTSPRVVERAEPRPGLDEYRALLLGPLMRRRKARGTEIR